MLETLARGGAAALPFTLSANLLAQAPAAPSNVRLTYGSDPQPGPDGSGRAVISPSDLRFLGFYRFPSSVGEMFLSSPAFARRVVNGRTRLFTNGDHRNGDWPLLEFEVPSTAPNPAIGDAPPLGLVRDWGHYRTGRVVTNNSTNPNYPGGLYWDESRQVLYWTYADAYTPNYWFPNVSATVLNDSAGTLASYGPWATSWLPQRTLGSMCEIPAWFATAYTGGRRVGMSAFPSSGASGGPWGACLSAARLPDPGAAPDPWNTSQRSIENHGLLLHDLQHRQSRDANYKVCGWNVPYDSGKGGTMSPGQPIWGTQDPGSGTVDAMKNCLWIDLPEKHGVLFFGQLATTPAGYSAPGDPDGHIHIWYGPGTCVHGQADAFFQATGPATHYRQVMGWIYNPNDLIGTAQGKTSLWGVRPTTDAFRFGNIAPIFNQKVHSRAWGGNAVFDPQTRRIYVAYLHWPHPASATQLCAVFGIA
jgi:hypothetical protein